MKNELFNETASAYEKVKAAVAELKREHSQVCLEIEKVKGELEAAPLAYIPLVDLKAGILEFIDASGDRYAERAVIGAISSFAKNGMAGSNPGVPSDGKPMRFVDIEEAITGRNAAAGWAQLMTPEKWQFNDQVFYLFFSEFVKKRLSELMDGMSLEQFGYNKIHPDKIGSDRETRKREIADLQGKLRALEDKRAELSSKLNALGVTQSISELFGAKGKPQS